MNSSTDSPPQYAKGGLITGPGWESIAKMSFDTDSYEYGAKWSGGPVEQRIPDSLCPNCRRDRHDYPLTSAVAQMWSSLDFNEGYDPDNDDSETVCPGSDVYGPAMPMSFRGASTYVDNISHVSFSMAATSWSVQSDAMVKLWSSMSDGVSNVVSAMQMWDGFKLPNAPITAETVHEWGYKPESNWNIDDLQKLKGGFTSKELIFPDMKDVVPNDLYACAPISQAALEAAPKAIEHEAPQPSGFDFSSINTDYPTYPTGKKKRK